MLPRRIDSFAQLRERSVTVSSRGVEPITPRRSRGCARPGPRRSMVHPHSSNGAAGRSSPLVRNDIRRPRARLCPARVGSLAMSRGHIIRVLPVPRRKPRRRRSAHTERHRTDRLVEARHRVYSFRREALSVLARRLGTRRGKHLLRRCPSAAFVLPRRDRRLAAAAVAGLARIREPAVGSPTRSLALFVARAKQAQSPCRGISLRGEKPLKHHPRAWPTGG